MANKQFRISSALKNIIGKDLITDDFIAVFELVKNSFDAHASYVDVRFEDLDIGSPKLIIQDDGKGMDIQDLENKWLFVAYSAKKDGSEDYRDKIKNVRMHAGAKGIGRFSCDKLGSHLKIHSRRKGGDKEINTLEVEWKDFESDPHVEFDDIFVLYQKTKDNKYKISHGTVLEISGLREPWSRDKLLKLRNSLEKLINPNQGNDSDNFSINLHAESEELADKEVDVDAPWNVVNGPIKNFLFEGLGLKTTFINVKVSEDGKYIHTRLEDRGTLIFEITEINPIVYDRRALGDIEVTLFALNRSAKIHFGKYMGTAPVNFGSVFLYKNGFRVHPVGEYGDDSLGLDSRKTQGTARYLGSRDVVGRIEINGENPDFQEASSRDGGLVKNQAYNCLRKFFYDYCLKRLERYAVDIVKYGNLGEDFDNALGLNTDIKAQILSLVQSLTQSENIVDLNYDLSVVDVFSDLSEKSLQTTFRNFKRIAAESNNGKLEKEAVKAEQRLEQLSIARQEAEEEAGKARKKADDIERVASKIQKEAKKAQEEAEKLAKVTEQKTTENIFLKTMISKDVSNIVSLHHHVGIAAETIEIYISQMTKRIKSGKPFSEDTVLELLKKISLQTRKISTTTKFATKANFNLDAAKVNQDICAYIGEYLLNVCSGVIKTKDGNKNIKFQWDNPKDIVFEIKFRLLELSIVFDNLISNSRKAGASEIVVTVEQESGGELLIKYRDDGQGITKESQRRIFDLAFTTTNGSGLGLYQTKEILSQIKGSIELVSSSKGKGTVFEMRVKK